MSLWKGGRLEQGCWVWVFISFEHPSKGEIKSGVIVAMMPSVERVVRYVVQVPGVGYITGLQPAEICPIEFGQPSGSVVASEAVLFKASKAAVGVRQHTRVASGTKADEAVAAEPGIAKTLPASRPSSRRRVYYYENCMYDVLSCVFLIF